MKKCIVNLSAVMIALFVGLAINNACAEKENPAGTPGTPEQGIDTDVLYYDGNGKVANRLASFSGNASAQALIDHMATTHFEDGQSASYGYDEDGRLASISWTVSYLVGESGRETVNIKVAYTYAGLIAKEKVTVLVNGSEAASYTNTYTYLPIE